MWCVCTHYVYLCSLCHHNALDVWLSNLHASLVTGNNCISRNRNSCRSSSTGEVTVIPPSNDASVMLETLAQPNLSASLVQWNLLRCLQQSCHSIPLLRLGQLRLEQVRIELHLNPVQTMSRPIPRRFHLHQLPWHP